MKVPLLLFVLLTTLFTKSLGQSEDRIQLAWECDDFRSAKEQFESNYCWFWLCFFLYEFEIYI